VKPESSRLTSPYQGDLKYQARILPGVSRTFALTIPVLPGRLAEVVTNAYLLCRLADTIEDDIGLDNEQKSDFHRRFVSVVEGNDDAESFAAALAPLLSSRVLPDERDLVTNAAKVIRVTHGLSAREQEALTRCVRIMCSGMPEFQRNKSLKGLGDLDELGDYCYVVAGVVGEMLTELFCVHCPELRSRREELMRLAVSFGQGLQMTNILKDIWDDRLAATCWLPRSVFMNGDFELERLDEFHDTEAFRAGMEQLISVAHGHLRNAFEYTCNIPAREVGIRRFCLWALGLAVLTLRKICRNPGFTSGDQVKVSRRTVRTTVLTTNLLLRSNRGLRLLFEFAAGGLPLADQRAQDAPAAVDRQGSLDVGRP
jgi:farnesyl-diphosphate farnesyltransferase